jgi:hypothetical protein
MNVQGISSAIPRLLLVGSLTRDFIFYPGEAPLLEVPGGRALYAASGAVIWEKQLALASQVGKGYPSHWCSLFQARGLQVDGIRILDQELESRAVYSYDEALRPGFPLVKACLRHGVPFPPQLLGYQPQKDASLTSCGFSPSLLPDSYHQAEGAYLCPMPLEYLAQWIAYLHTHGVKRLVATFPGLLDVSPEYAQRLSFLEGLEVLIIHEKDLQRLFWGLSHDLWEMASWIGRFVPKVVISLSSWRYLLYLASSRERWEIPAYSLGRFPIGLEDAFGGGLLAGLIQTAEPQQAVLYGAVSLAFKSESLDPFYPWEVMPDLARSRLQYLNLLIVPA